MNPYFLLIVMVLTVYRLTRLVVKDTLPPVLWVRDRLAGGWRPMTSFESADQGATVEIGGITNLWVNRVSWSPDWLGELITCPWCASGWITGAVVLATDLTVGMPLPWLSGPAVWGAAALIASKDWA